MKKQVFVGGSLNDAAMRVRDAWKKAEADGPIAAQDNLTFIDWSSLSASLTEKRFELLRHLHRQPAKSIRGLARDLGRDVKRVHEDVTVLERLGLIDRDGTSLTASYSEIQTSILIGSPAA